MDCWVVVKGQEGFEQCGQRSALWAVLHAIRTVLMAEGRVSGRCWRQVTDCWRFGRQEQDGGGDAAAEAEDAGLALRCRRVAFRSLMISETSVGWKSGVECSAEAVDGGASKLMSSARCGLLVKKCSGGLGALLTGFLFRCSCGPLSIIRSMKLKSFGSRRPISTSRVSWKPVCLALEVSAVYSK